MITILIGCVFGAVIGFFIFPPKVEQHKQVIPCLCARSIFGMAVGGILGLVIASLIGENYFLKTQVSGQEVKLHPFRNIDVTSGPFFLGSDVIGGHKYYFFFEEAHDGYT